MTGKTVLVVDDEIHIVHVVAIKLRSHGYKVLSAENGAEALELSRQTRPDIIVADFQMPIMTGLELVEKIRSERATADIPVIMLTARGFAIEPQQKEQLQITEFLSKPFSPKELLRCVEDILYQRTVMQQNP
jgi:CheY-like chemotaxis protein